MKRYGRRLRDDGFSPVDAEWRDGTARARENEKAQAEIAAALLEAAEEAEEEEHWCGADDCCGHADIVDGCAHCHDNEEGANG